MSVPSMAPDQGRHAEPLAAQAPPPVPAAQAILPGSLAAWLMAIRPRSLWVAASPVLMAAALVFLRDGRIDSTLALLALAAALMIQVITNLQNDVGYTTRGAERRATRLGLPRATALGLLSPEQVRGAIVAAVAVTLMFGLPLVLMRGATVLMLGLASIAAAIAYMGGRKPIAYTPFGEAAVFVFFGLIAVVGIDLVLTGRADAVTTWIAAAAMGSVAAAALLVNNTRDMQHDQAVGRRTLPVVLGKEVAHRVFALCVFAPFALTIPMAWIEKAPWLLLPLGWLPFAVVLVRDFTRCPPGLPYNRILFRTFQLEMQFALLIAIGAVLTRVFGMGAGA